MKRRRNNFFAEKLIFIINMKRETTERGFGIYKFKDHYGLECSLQESSLATESAIWLGIAENKVEHCIADKGWVPVELPKDTLVHNRMHLTREQVKEIIPLLQKFVDDGEL